jgi:opacity protein-like surface antigen
MKNVLIAASLALAFAAAPAFADCASDIAKIEEAMKTTTLDEAGTKLAKETLDKAMAASVAKDEAACTVNTAELMKMLGMTG